MLAFSTWEAFNWVLTLRCKARCKDSVLYAALISETRRVYTTNELLWVASFELQVLGVCGEEEAVGANWLQLSNHRDNNMTVIDIIPCGLVHQHFTLS